MARSTLFSPAVFGASLARGVAVGASIGVVIFGLLETLVWPVVGTLFGAFEGVAAGSVVGFLAAVAICSVPASQVFAVRTVAAVTALVGFAGWVQIVESSWSISRGCAVVAGAGLMAGVAPMVRSGVESTTSDGVPIAWLFERYVMFGVVGGAIVGGLVGLMFGLVGHAPTAPFAMIEGAILGAVSAGVLTLLVLGVLVLPRLRVRR